MVKIKQGYLKERFKRIVSNKKKVGFFYNFFVIMSPALVKTNVNFVNIDPRDL